MRLAWAVRIGLMLLAGGGLLMQTTTATADPQPVPIGICEGVRLRASARYLSGEGEGAAVYQVMCAGAPESLRDYAYEWKIEGQRPAFCEFATTDDAWTVSLDATCPLSALVVQVTISNTETAKLRLRISAYCERLNGCYQFP